MVGNTVDPPQLSQAKRIIQEAIARLSEKELYELANRIRTASTGALFGDEAFSKDQT